LTVPVVVRHVLHKFSQLTCFQSTGLVDVKLLGAVPLLCVLKDTGKTQERNKEEKTRLDSWHGMWVALCLHVLAQADPSWKKRCRYHPQPHFLETSLVLLFQPLWWQCRGGAEECFTQRLNSGVRRGIVVDLRA
jgi:hypothetical protein